MNHHIGDTNEMVSKTPRTDAVWELFATDTTLEPDVEFSGLARQLERELNESNQRIKRLEEAVDAYRTAYTPDGHVAPHDCFATGPKTGDSIQDLIACPGCWAERKAKEAKL